MLTKLLKYEFKSTSRLLLILYAVLLAFGAVVGLVMRIGGFWDSPSNAVELSESAVRLIRVLTGSLFVGYGLLIMAVGVLTIVMIVVRFYRNLLGGEGYLMHTLPVPTWQLVTSKLITGCVWTVVTLIVGALSVLLLLLTSGALAEMLREITWKEFQDFLRMITQELPLRTMIPAWLIGIPASILMFYFAMSLGNLANEHKVLFSVLAYFGINTVVSFFSSALSFRRLVMLDAYAEYTETLSQILLRNTIVEAVLAVGFFIGTVLILKKRLNLA